jgi:hypothetical protein
MVAGDPFRRNNTLATNADKANTWAWYVGRKYEETEEGGKGGIQT